MVISNRWVIWVTLFIGLFLQVIPLPESMQMFEPHWLMLILVYWVISFSGQVNFLITAFVIGLIFDLFSGAILGTNALILVVITYGVSLKAQMIRNIALWQQVFVIFILSLSYDIFLYIFQIILFKMNPYSPAIFLSSLSDSVIWIAVYFILSYVQSVGHVE